MERKFTNREMRAIIEYLKERKAYGELKGNAIWMEFAKSGHTIRTWSSLKKTFLNKILPDIENPLYTLTEDEVRSFKAGMDVTKHKKRLVLNAAASTINEVNGRENVTKRRDKEVGKQNEAAIEKPESNNITNRKSRSKLRNKKRVFSRLEINMLKEDAIRRAKTMSVRIVTCYDIDLLALSDAEKQKESESAAKTIQELNEIDEEDCFMFPPADPKSNKSVAGSRKLFVTLKRKV